MRSAIDIAIARESLAQPARKALAGRGGNEGEFRRYRAYPQRPLRLLL